MGDTTKGRLHVSKFPHSSNDQSRSDSEKWRDWDGLLQSAFGEQHPLVVAQYSFKCDPKKTYFGLPWHKMLNVDELDAEKEAALHTPAAWGDKTVPSMIQARSPLLDISK